MSAPPPAPRGRGRGRAIPRGAAPSRPTPTATATAASPPNPSSLPTSLPTSSTHPPPPTPRPTRPTPQPSAQNPNAPPAAPRPLGTLRDGPGAFRPTAGNLARKPEDLARTGVSKLKFMPKLPVARGKREPEDVKPPTPTPGPSAPTRGTFERGRGRGRGAPPGAGRGGGELQMTASGPFALGPSALLTSSRPRPSSGPGPIPLPSHPSSSSTPSAHSVGGLGLQKRPALVLAEAEQYSDEEVEIVDLDAVEGLDESAPSSLKRVKVLKGKERVKRERERAQEPALGLGRMGEIRTKLEPSEPSTTSLHSSALPSPSSKPPTSIHPSPPDSDSEAAEGETDAEDLLPAFLLPQPAPGALGLELDPEAGRERVYWFQFPRPFPVFEPAEADPGEGEGDVEMVDAPLAGNTGPGQAGGATSAGPSAAAAGGTQAGEKTVRFSGEGIKAEDRKPSFGAAHAGGRGPKPAPPKVDGVIGRMELFANGRVKIVLGEGIVMEVRLPPILYTTVSPTVLSPQYSTQPSLRPCCLPPPPVPFWHRDCR